MSDVKFRDAYYGIETIRYDSEYYLKNYLRVEKKINDNPQLFDKFSKLGLTVDGSAFYPALEPFYGQGMYPFIRVGDVKQVVDFENCVKVPFNILSDYPTLKHVQKGDIVLTKGGTIGIAGLITENACVSRDLIFINSSILPEKDYTALYLFLSSKFCYDQLIRSSSQSVQPHLTITLVRNLLIYKFSSQIRENIVAVYKRGVDLLRQSKRLYVEAEDYLLEQLGLTNWQPAIKSSNTKTLKESFLVSGRLDAEYYQPKYDELLGLLTNVKTKPLGKIVHIKKSIEPGSDAYRTEGIPFIRVADLSKTGISKSSVYLDPLQYGDNEFKSEKEETKLEPRKDTILLSKDGSVGIAYKVEQDIKGITSGAILHLTIIDKEFLPDYLTLVLNSIIVKLQAERDAGGSIIQHWKPDEIKKVIIPRLNRTTQAKIAEKTQASFRLQNESEILLEAAKKAVEITIEQGEQFALNYLQSLKHA